MNQLFFFLFWSAASHCRFGFSFYLECGKALPLWFFFFLNFDCLNLLLVRTLISQHWLFQAAMIGNFAENFLGLFEVGNPENAEDLAVAAARTAVGVFDADMFPRAVRKYGPYSPAGS